MLLCLIDLNEFLYYCALLIQVICFTAVDCMVSIEGLQVTLLSLSGVFSRCQNYGQFVWQ